MPTQLIAQILAYLGAAIGVIVVLPQILRTMRHPHLTGVSATSSRRPWRWEPP